MNNLPLSHDEPHGLPQWVHFIAQDADGQWWGYEAEPHQYDNGWYENEVGRNIKLDKESTNQNWKDTFLQIRRF